VKMIGMGVDGIGNALIWVIIPLFTWANSGRGRKTNPSSRTMALGSTQPLTEMSTRNLPGGKGRPAREAGHLTAICEPTV
jgi:hypothetical protein